MYRPKLNLFLRTSLPLLAASALLAGCGDKDRSPSKKKETDDGTGGLSGMGGEQNDPDDPPVIAPVACEEDSECDDYFFCNGQEKCIDNLCRQGQRVDCDDGVECTVDRCIEDTQECESEAPDKDGDGHADASCEDEQGNPLGDDCNDDDSLSYPGNTEVCDPEGRDEDCDPSTFGSLDTDQDGFIDAKCCNSKANGDLNCGDDCDDNKTNVNPSSTEACDFLDNNCDGETDEGVSISMYEDKDHDGHGDDDTGTVQSCAGAVGYATIAGDCDDNDPEVFTGQFEICDNKDNNCNDAVDEVRELAPWYKDVDGDGYGDPESTPILSCYRIPGRVLSQNDCNDAANTVNPNATEICDGLDNDCNGAADFKLAGNNNFEDDDGDGAADADCGGTDCNDTDARTSEGAEEVCDRIDNDCDGEVDEQTVQNIWYIDDDGDGWGVVIGSALASCDPIPNRASQFGDCNDNDASVKPGVTELCDGIDQDCDGIIDEGAGVHCHLPDALSTCRFGHCAVFSCLPGRADLNKDPTDGCEGDAPNADTGTLCNYDAFCNDGDLCNGIETCTNGTCHLGTPIDCDAGPSVLQGNHTINGWGDIKDLEGIDLITGDLFINGTTLTSLVGLEALHVIGGNLYIQGNDNLIRLSGSALSNLEVVGGDIIIEGNQSLTSASLPSLVSANALVIYDNDNLVELKGFQNLANIDQLLQIEENDVLETITQFESLGRVGGDYVQTEGACDGSGGLEIQFNPGLETMDAFGSLGQIEGDLCITDNDNLTDIAFEALDHVGLSVYLSSLYSLATLEAPNLRSVGSDFYVGGGEGGEVPLDVLAMPSLLGIGGELHYEGSATNLEELAFPDLTDANGIYVVFYSPDALVNVDFSSLEMATSIYIDYYANQTGVPAWKFPNLVDVAEDFTLYLTGDITDVSAPLLENAGNIYFNITSDFMESLDFQALQQTAGDLYVSTSSGNANVLNNVDFGALTVVAPQGDYYSQAAFYTPTAALDIGQLTGAGQLLDGTLYLYVAPFDVCAQVDRIVAQPNFLGSVYEDFGCSQSAQAGL